MEQIRIGYLLGGIAVMAVVTYIIRMLPMAYYVPYTVLGAMTFPAIFYSTQSVPSAAAGCAAAVVLAYRGKGLLIVAVGAAAAVFAVQLLMNIIIV